MCFPGLMIVVVGLTGSLEVLEVFPVLKGKGIGYENEYS